MKTIAETFIEKRAQVRQNKLQKINQARDRRTSPDTLVRLAADRDFDIKWRVARNPSTPLAGLEILVKDPHWGHQVEAANHPNATPALALQAAKSPDSQTRYSIARANKFPEVLAYLAKDRTAVVRSAVAENPNTPPDLLAVLAKDLAPSVRSSVPWHPSVTPQMLTQLGKDPHRDVTQSVQDRLAEK